MATNWESEIASFLTDLSAVQQETLDVLAQKRECIANSDAEGIRAIGQHEEHLIQKLKGCLERRKQMLHQARAEGRPAESVTAISESLGQSSEGKQIRAQVAQARHQAKLLQNASLTNWVVVQKSLLHLSQMLEIIATKGRMQPTYSNNHGSEAGQGSGNGGALIDRAA